MVLTEFLFWARNKPKHLLSRRDNPPRISSDVISLCQHSREQPQQLGAQYLPQLKHVLRKVDSIGFLDQGNIMQMMVEAIRGDVLSKGMEVTKECKRADSAVGSGSWRERDIA
jgi:hypothetical protein